MKRSAGILLYRLKEKNKPEFFLVHPGGPFWKNKNTDAWSIPKGEYDVNEDPLEAAQREFEEETGIKLNSPDFIKLQDVKMKSRKIISAWACEGDADETKITSNNFKIEWPPRTGKYLNFPEVDKGGWFFYEEAIGKINPAQIPFLLELKNLLSE